MTAADMPINSVFDDLFAEDQSFVAEVRGALSENPDLLEKVCQFVVDKIGHENVVNFVQLEAKLKTHACLDYLAIGIVSGKIGKNEILHLIR